MRSTSRSTPLGMIVAPLSHGSSDPVPRQSAPAAAHASDDGSRGVDRAVDGVGSAIAARPFETALAALIVVAALVLWLTRRRRRARAAHAHSTELLQAARALVDLAEKGAGASHARDTELALSQTELGRQLAAVQRSVGELSGLASGLGSLDRALGSVKLRGLFGEAQLEELLLDVLSPTQYVRQAQVRPDASERVDFALRLRGVDGEPVLLPIDAKFPQEDFARLVDARERGDRDGEAKAARALASRVRAEARRIRDRYIRPPHTTEFAVLFVPAESLFAELLRAPGLLDGLYRESRVVLVGPASAAALLGAVSMGLRAAGIEDRAGELWRRVSELEHGLDRLLQSLGRTQAQLSAASRTLAQAEAGARGMRDRAGSEVGLEPRLDQPGAPDTGSRPGDR